MDNPVETIGIASKRLAGLAAIRVMLCAVGPALTAIALGVLLDSVDELTWTRYGFWLSPDSTDALSLALIGAGVIVLAAGAVMAFRAYRRANDFVAAAVQLDDLLESKQEIVTFATLADPSAPEGSRARRTPLFPLLWRRAIALFVGLDIRREFRLEVGGPLKRSSILAGVVALVMILATLGLVRAPTPENLEAAKLRAIAKEIAKTATSTDDTVLADKIRQAADALENSKLPPQEKKQRIEEAMRQADQAAEKRHNSQSGKDQGTGKSNAQNQNGNGKSQGQGNSQGSGSGEGKAETAAGQNAGGNSPGPGKGGSGSSSGKNQNGRGSANNDKNAQNKSDQNNIELHDELAKAEAQVETANAKNPGPNNQPGNDKNQGGGNKPGDKIDQNKTGSQPDMNHPGDIPKPGANGDRNIPSAGGNNKDNRDMGSNLGNTHLGEFPTSKNAQRYLKPGENGSATDIKDARYVMFRIPGAPIAGSGGRSVLDADRPKATTAYVNAPLAPTSDDAPPDERQLVPPRYRDMIH